MTNNLALSIVFATEVTLLLVLCFSLFFCAQSQFISMAVGILTFLDIFHCRNYNFVWLHHPWSQNKQQDRVLKVTLKDYSQYLQMSTHMHMHHLPGPYPTHLNFAIFIGSSWKQLFWVINSVVLRRYSTMIAVKKLLKRGQCSCRPLSDFRKGAKFPLAAVSQLCCLRMYMYASWPKVSRHPLHFARLFVCGIVIADAFWVILKILVSSES